MQPNLTSLDSAKAWLNVATTTDDQLLYRLIGQVSRAILSHLQRPSIFQQTYNDVYDGAGRERQILRNWPVLSVSSLTIGTCTIPAATSYGQAGWTLESWDGFPPGHQQSVNVQGFQFWNGHGNVAVTYVAGYVVQNEAQTVPASSPYSLAVNAYYGNWGADAGVTYANGTLLTQVSGSPSVGQYAVSKGIYTFAAADSGASVLISYSFIPADIQEACNDIVAERYRYQGRIGERSHSLGGQESVSFDNSGLTDFAKLLLRPYKKVTFT